MNRQTHAQATKKALSLDSPEKMEAVKEALKANFHIIIFWSESRYLKEGSVWRQENIERLDTTTKAVSTFNKRMQQGYDKTKFSINFNFLNAYNGRIDLGDYEEQTIFNHISSFILECTPTEAGKMVLTDEIRKRFISVFSWLFYDTNEPTNEEIFIFWDSYILEDKLLILGFDPFTKPQTAIYSEV